MKVDNVENLAWEQDLWTRITAYTNNGRLPHALLLWGSKGLGKAQFASALAEGLLCMKNELKACGTCQSCHWWEKSIHPDCVKLNPAEGKSIIGVDTVRAMHHQLNRTSVSGKGLVVTITLAEAMNSQAANALLKCLEEPPSKVHFILLSEQIGLLPQTIKSRCQVLYFPLLNDETVKSYLNAQGMDESLAFLLQGAPLLARKRLDSAYLNFRQAVYDAVMGLKNQDDCPIRVAADWHKENIDDLLDSLISWFLDSLKLKMRVKSVSLANQDSVVTLKEYSRTLETTQVIMILDKLIELKKTVLNHMNINKALWLEDLAISLRF